MVTYEYVATAGQTTFSGTDANGATLSYVANSISVSLNGVTLRPGDDYTATNGTSIVLTSAAALNDELMVIAFAVFNVANAVAKTGDTMTGSLLLPAGTVSAPALTTSADTNTGVFFPAADTVAIGTGGSERVRVDSSGTLKTNVGGVEGIQLATDLNSSTVSSRLLFSETGSTLALLNSSGNLFFNTGVSKGSSSGTTRVVFNANGVGLGGSTPSSGTGIAFPATQSASSDANTLDDYEEGTWTPAIAGGSGTTYTTQNGWYTKIGNLVTIGFDLVINAKGTISGTAQITGLPFTSGIAVSRGGSSFAVANNTGTAYVFTAGFVDLGVTVIDIYIKTAAATSTSVPTGTAFFAAGTQLIASFSYRV
jgi:hypothetical protein